MARILEININNDCESMLINKFKAKKDTHPLWWVTVMCRSHGFLRHSLCSVIKQFAVGEFTSGSCAGLKLSVIQ